MPQCPRQGRPPAPPGSPKRPALPCDGQGSVGPPADQNRRPSGLAGRVARLAPFECQSVGPLPKSHQADYWRVPQSLAMSPSRQKEQSLELSAVAGFPARVRNDRLYSSQRERRRTGPRPFRAESKSIVSLFKEKDDEPSWPARAARVPQCPRQGRPPPPRQPCQGRRSSFPETRFASRLGRALPGLSAD